MKLKSDFITNASKIKNIIFDWGGVITNIDYHSTSRHLQKFGALGLDDFFTQFKQSQIFDLFETGDISVNDFLSEFKNLIGADIPVSEVRTAWLSMLKDTPKERLHLILDLAKEYKVYLLSNTNDLHCEFMRHRIKSETGIDMFSDVFNKVFLSQEIGIRKPNPSVFQFVVSDQHLNAHETLFIDDSPQHIEGATKAGLNAYHLTNGITILDLFE